MRHPRARRSRSGRQTRARYLARVRPQLRELPAIQAEHAYLGRIATWHDDRNLAAVAVYQEMFL
jgi:hypothetical protein